MAALKSLAFGACTQEAAVNTVHVLLQHYCECHVHNLSGSWVEPQGPDKMSTATACKVRCGSIRVNVDASRLLACFVFRDSCSISPLLL